MKHVFTFLLVLFVTLFSAGNVFADEPAKAPEAKAAPAKPSPVTELLEKQLSVLTDEEKNKVLDSIKNPGVAHQIADFGAELGNGLASSAKNLGVAANEFANSGIGKITAFFIIWHFFGRSILWFIFIMVVLTATSRAIRKFFGIPNEKGKIVKYSFENVSGDACLGILVVTLIVLCLCFFGAAVNF